jgi:hypothetical protein
MKPPGGHGALWEASKFLSSINPNRFYREAVRCRRFAISPTKPISLLPTE